MPDLVVLTKTRKTKKDKYCKRCGNLIDSKTQKCSGCGKQYFHFSKLAVVWCILCVLIICLAGLNVYQYIGNGKTVAQLNEKFESLEKAKNEYEQDNDELKLKNTQLSASLFSNMTELEFWDNNAVICTTTGSKYHHYGCVHLKGRDFYIYNTENAVAKGYTPCLDCCGG